MIRPACWLLTSTVGELRGVHRPSSLLSRSCLVRTGVPGQLERLDGQSARRTSLRAGADHYHRRWTRHSASRRSDQRGLRDQPEQSRGARSRPGRRSRGARSTRSRCGGTRRRRGGTRRATVPGDGDRGRRDGRRSQARIGRGERQYRGTGPGDGPEDVPLSSGRSGAGTATDSRCGDEAGRGSHETLRKTEFGSTQPKAYEETFEEPEAINAADDDGVKVIGDWIVERIHDKEKLPTSRAVRREAARVCRADEYRIRNDEWLER